MLCRLQALLRMWVVCWRPLVWPLSGCRRGWVCCCGSLLGLANLYGWCAAIAALCVLYGPVSRLCVYWGVLGRLSGVTWFDGNGMACVFGMRV